MPHDHQTLTEAIHRALGEVIDPELRRPITELGMLRDFSVDTDGHVTVEVLLTVAACPMRGVISSDVKAALAPIRGVSKVSVVLDVMTTEQRTALKEQLKGSKGRVIPFNDPSSLTRIYAVTSGKGGVGKSSLTANLASAMAAKGLRVGIVDADVYGFSIPGLMGIDQAPTRMDDMILPPVAFGVKVISTGMFISGNKPVVWRGPMLHRALEQFLRDVYFGDLDVLFIDLPPGTGDIAISISQLLPQARILVVTTPQSAAAEVAERSGLIAAQTGQLIAGVIENMSWLELEDGRRMELFGSGGGATTAERLSSELGEDVALLGTVPLEPLLREGGDRGRPLVTADGAAGASPAAKALRDLAAALASRPLGLARRPLGISPA
ncbi:Mrp/NBP35 family ATP-binding protein [Arthrobacter sp. EPSL27]|uniref:Mrp/NBP35 family ATP-binding protein n=1 Tax=Arthrobacter sp. EPSL27 TaxID=1745378 RepID=UPI000746EE38|nr:P-loop NTPase [Arthrobacter sp. EPSL27]KUM37423.1 sodium:proton antiporter [Arthrobacter sp. EPSL27]